MRPVYAPLGAAMALALSVPATAATTVSDGNGTFATIYDDAAEWAAALAGGDVVSEDFSDTAMASGLSLGGYDYTIADGVLAQTLRNTANYLSLDFARGASALAFDYDLTPGDVGSGIWLNLGFENTSISLPALTAASGFYGIIANAPMLSLNFAARQYRTEAYTMDNVRFVAAGVPEPATWAMLILGFGLTGIAMRHRRRASLA